MLAIVLPITFSFFGLMIFFVSVAIGCQPITVPEAFPVTELREIELSAVSTTAAGEEEEAGTEQHQGQWSLSRDVAAVQVGLEGHESKPSETTSASERPRPVLIGWRVVLGLMAYIFIPFLDNMTDLAFLLSNPFFDVHLFIAFCAAYSAPSLGFAKTLFNKSAVPRFYLCPMPQRLIFSEYKLYLRVPLVEIPVDFSVYGMYVFGTESAKHILGDDPDAAGLQDRKHRFSVSQTVDGTRQVFTDHWIDDAGHIHNDEIRKPLLAHMVADLLELQERVDRLSPVQ